MQYSISNWQDAVLVASTTVLTKILSFLPNLFGALLVFLLGWIVSGWVKTLVTKVLSVTKLERAVRGTVIEAFLVKAEVKGKIEEIIGRIARAIVIFIFFIAAVNILGLPTVSQVLNSILAYIPHVISAILILLAGMILAGIVESIVKGATGAVAVSTSRLLGKVSSWLVMIFTTLAAISELGIAEQFINTLLIGVVATLTLGIGLAIGLGSKDVVNEALTEWYHRVKRELKG